MIEDIKKLLLESDNLIFKIKNDVSRKNIEDLTEKLIKLSIILGEAKLEYTKFKTSYKINYPRICEDIQNNAKEKGEKITISQTEKQADILLEDTIKKKGEYEGIMLYLQPIIDSYRDHINGIKFIDKESNKTI